MADVNGDEDENAGERPGDNQKDSEAPERDGEGAAKSATPTSIKDVAWEIFKPVAALGFIVSLVGAIALYVYLQRIGWPELLQPSLASKTGVALVVGSSIVVLASLVITMYGSAYWTNFVAHSYGQPASIPRRFGWFVLVLHLGWLVILAGVMLGSGDAKPVPEVARKQIHSLSENFQSGIVVFFGAAAAASVLLHWWGRRNLFDSLAGALTGGSDGRFRLLLARLQSIGRKPDSPQQGGADSWVCRVFTWARAGRVLADAGRGLQLAVGCLFSSLAACVFVEINPDIGASDVTIPLVLMLCAVTLPGMVVGIRYAACYRATGNAKTSVKEVAWLVLLMGLAACSLFPAKTLLPLDSLSLGAVSVFGRTSHQYVLEKPERRALYEMVGFTFASADASAVRNLSASEAEAGTAGDGRNVHHSTVETEPPALFDAYERYHMGDILLLCTWPNDGTRAAAGSAASSVSAGSPDAGASAPAVSSGAAVSSAPGASAHPAVSASSADAPRAASDSARVAVRKGCLPVEKGEVRRVEMDR